MRASRSAQRGSAAGRGLFSVARAGAGRAGAMGMGGRAFDAVGAAIGAATGFALGVAMGAAIGAATGAAIGAATAGAAVVIAGAATGAATGAERGAAGPGRKAHMPAANRASAASSTSATLRLGRTTEVAGAGAVRCVGLCVLFGAGVGAAFATASSSS